VEAVREILSDATVLENFSVREVEDELKIIISAAVQIPSQQRQAYIKSAVTTLLSSFVAQLQDYQFVAPISNLKIGRSLKIGDVTFKIFSTYQAKKWTRYFWDTLKNNPHYTTVQKKEFVKSVEEHNLKPLKDSVCGEIICRGKEERAKEVALAKINTALDIIKLYCMVEPGQRESNFGLKGEVLDLCRRSLLQHSLSQKTLVPTLELVGPLFPIDIDSKILQWMKKQGLRSLSKILQKKDKSWVERKILLSTYWYSRIFDTPLRRIDEEKILIRRRISSARKEEALEYGCVNERLVKAFTALEALFIISEGEPVQNSIAERAALILEKSYQNRRLIKRFLKDMYKFRSDIVHRGFTYVSIGELNELVHVVRASIITILLRKDRLKLDSQEDFNEYFEKQKLS
jgi:hypothetical protein